MARKSLASVLLVCAFVLSGCNISIPSDPDNTLQQVTSGTLRVGVVLEPGITWDSDATTAETQLAGPAIDAVLRFAESIDAEVLWTVGGEESLVEQLEEQRLDLAVGGFTEDTPWIDRVGITQPFRLLSQQSSTRYVMLAPQGENRFITELELYLGEEFAK